MKFSLITVTRQAGSEVAGHWVQNHIGTLESASARARHTERMNGNKITVAVVDEVISVVPMLNHHCYLTRLDVAV